MVNHEEGGLDLARRRLLLDIAAQVGTPVYVYDAAILRRQLASLQRFDRVRFAQKACANVHILRLLRAAGAYVDCVSPGELARALAAGFRGGAEPAEIVYTADLLTDAIIDRVLEAGVPVNAGSEDMLTQLGERRVGHPVWLRINPGFGHGHSHKVNTGGEASKHGIWHENLSEALARVQRYGLSLVGLHMHIGSGADLEHLGRVGDAMVRAVQQAGHDLRAVSGGGGLPVPYREGEAAIDPSAHFDVWDAARRRIEAHLGHPVDLEIEPGRYLVAQAGVLLAEVRATKSMGGNHFTIVDAGFNDLVRPAMYGAHHRISLLSRGSEVEARPPRRTLVAGPLCESGDVFTQDASGYPAPRELPQARVGDVMVFHDAGAYGASMSSNYNSRPLAAEVLIEGDVPRLIRRRQTIQELLLLEEV
ncbi:MAG: diaminopimelate decarboxylase [Myxococcales bacterium]|nr:MAG: diaminopimelate decarboxylase [Myxococcales bacterium]